MATPPPGTITGGAAYKTWSTKIVTDLAKAARSVQAGFFEQSRYPDTQQPIAYIAAINNFGTENGRIPARPFMQHALTAAERLIPKLIPKLADDQSLTIPQQTADEIGQTLTRLIREAITRFHTPGNAPATIAKKGDDAPLRDTGQLLISVTHETT